MLLLKKKPYLRKLREVFVLIIIYRKRFFNLFVARSKERKAKCEEWLPKYFQQDLKTGQWVYKHSDLRPWDPRNDLYQFEYNYVIQTRTKHATPMIRTASIVSVEPQSVKLINSCSLSSFYIVYLCFRVKHVRQNEKQQPSRYRLMLMQMIVQLLKSFIQIRHSLLRSCQLLQIQSMY